MPSNERQQYREADPKRVLERYLKPLHQTQTTIRDFRMHGRLAEKGTGVLSHPAVDPKIDFGIWAKRYADTLDDTDLTKMLAKIIGVVPSAMRGLKAMGQKGKNRWNTRTLAELNETVRFSIDNHGSIPPEVLTGIYKSTALNYGYTAPEINELIARVERGEQGMRHEIGHDSMMYRLPDEFIKLETTIDDDINGIDSRWQAPNGVVLEFDIKASEESAYRSNMVHEALYRRAGRKVPANKLIVHSGFSDADFSEHHWRPNEDAIMRELPKVEHMVYAAAGMERPDVSSEVKW